MRILVGEAITLVVANQIVFWTMVMLGANTYVAMTAAWVAGWWSARRYARSSRGDE